MTYKNYQICMVFLTLLYSIICTAKRIPLQSSETYQNPIKYDGADPQITQVGDIYYFTVTRQTEIRIWKTKDPTDLDDSKSTVIFGPPNTGPFRQIWAPEISYIQNTWYIHFTAATDNLQNLDDHRIYVLMNQGKDPTWGLWRFMGQIETGQEDNWALDPTVFEVNGQLYMSWAAMDQAKTHSQIMIAKMSDPLTLSSEPQVLSYPEFEWEQQTQGKVNEGPQFWSHGDTAFITYSANDCASDKYSLGLLTAQLNSDLSASASWTKSDIPVLRENPSGSVYATGHNGFFKSPDGKEDWIVFHANPGPNLGCGIQRSTHAQRFNYNPDGTPNFGQTVPLDQQILKPSGL